MKCCFCLEGKKQVIPLNLDCLFSNFPRFLQDFFPPSVEHLIIQKQHFSLLNQGNAESCRSFLDGKSFLSSYLKFICNTKSYILCIKKPTKRSDFARIFLYLLEDPFLQSLKTRLKNHINSF